MYPSRTLLLRISRPFLLRTKQGPRTGSACFWITSDNIAVISRVGGVDRFVATRASLKPRPEEWEEEEEEEEEERKKQQQEAKGKTKEDWKPPEEEEKKTRKKRWPKLLVWSTIPLMGSFSYHEIKRLRDPTHPLRRWEISCYRMFPWRTVSRTWGFINNVELPVWARTPFLTWYSKTFGCEICEAEVEELTEYKNLGDFFRRALKPGVRPICPNSQIVSPADGTVLFSGLVKNGMVEQVKGVSYSLQAFLGPNTWEGANRFLVPDKDYETSLLQDPENNCLYTSVIYLAPGDYHRFHSPTDWNVRYRRHFGGELLSVNPRMAQWITGLFTLNERAVYLGEWKHGFFSMTAVGATNVGSIRVYDDSELSTNTWKLRKNTWRDKKLDLEIKKGELFGEFNLGSTIVLLFEAPRNTQIQVPTSNKVQVGCSMVQSAAVRKTSLLHASS